MKISDICEDGIIVKGINTTVDVKPGETERQAAKFFGKGKPEELHKKARKNSDPNTLYNMGLVSERTIKQSEPIRVLDNIARRKDNEPFPIKMYDGSVMQVRPSSARRIMSIYFDVDEQKQKAIITLLKTKNGFKELLKKVESVNIDDDLLAEAWHNK